MSIFAPLDEPEERQHRRRLATSVNAALRAETANTGQFTVEAGGTAYSLIDSRIRLGRTIHLCPRDEAAASLQWWVENMEKGKASLRFIGSIPASGALFGYSIHGSREADYTP